MWVLFYIVFYNLANRNGISLDIKYQTAKEASHLDIIINFAALSNITKAVCNQMQGFKYKGEKRTERPSKIFYQIHFSYIYFLNIYISQIKM